jgi:hypothetical protein
MAVTFGCCERRSEEESAPKLNRWGKGSETHLDPSLHVDLTDSVDDDDRVRVHRRSSKDDLVSVEPSGEVVPVSNITINVDVLCVAAGQKESEDQIEGSQRGSNQETMNGVERLTFSRVGGDKDESGILVGSSGSDAIEVEVVEMPVDERVRSVLTRLGLDRFEGRDEVREVARAGSPSDGEDAI